MGDFTWATTDFNLYRVLKFSFWLRRLSHEESASSQVTKNFTYSLFLLVQIVGILELYKNTAEKL